MRCRWQRVDDFVGAGVVEAFAGFVFDGARVGFEAVNVLSEARVFFRELVDFLGEGLVFGALLVPAVEAVASIDHVPGKEQREDDRGDGADTAAVERVMGRPALQEGLLFGLGSGGHGWLFEAVQFDGFVVIPGLKNETWGTRFKLLFRPTLRMAREGWGTQCG